MTTDRRTRFTRVVGLCIVLFLLAACGSPGTGPRPAATMTPTPMPSRDLLLTPPVPGIIFPRQAPVEGERTGMLAELVGTLRLDPGGCLRVRALDGTADVLPIWPPEFTLRFDGDQVLVVDGEGQVATRVGEEVYMAGGYVSVNDEWVLQQIPTACRGSYFVVGYEVRPNLRYDSELFDLEVASTAGCTLLFMHYKPALDEQVTDAESIAGKLVAYDYHRCVHLQTEWGSGVATLLWPPDWSLQASEGAVTILDGTGQAIARLGDDVLLRARSVPHTIDSHIYRLLIDELPGDCRGATWLVDEIEGVAPALMPTPTPTPAPSVRGIHTPEDMQRQYDEWPEGYKLAVNPEGEVVVLFAYPDPLTDWVGRVFINHIPSFSSVTLGYGGQVVDEHYGSEEGQARLQAVLDDPALMARIRQRVDEIWAESQSG